MRAMTRLTKVHEHVPVIHVHGRHIVITADTTVRRDTLTKIFEHKFADQLDALKQVYPHAAWTSISPPTEPKPQSHDINDASLTIQYAIKRDPLLAAPTALIAAHVQMRDSLKDAVSTLQDAPSMKMQG